MSPRMKPSWSPSPSSKPAAGLVPPFGRAQAIPRDVRRGPQDGEIRSHLRSERMELSRTIWMFAKQKGAK